MLKKEKLSPKDFNINHRILYPASAKRGSNGGWSIELYIGLEIELEDGRKLTIDNRCIQLKASQIGRKQESVKKRIATGKE
jgi:hypothetical protein